MTAIAIEGGAKTDARRTRILEATLGVIVDRGYANTRIADVAARIDISPALVMYYYKTKDRLLAEATRYAKDLRYEEGTRRMKAIESAGGRLEELVRLNCVPQTGVGAADSWSLWLDLWSQALRHAEVRAVREDFHVHWRETIRQVVRDGQASGEFALVDLDDFAIAFSALLNGFAVQIALEDPVADVYRCFNLSMRWAAAELRFAWKPSGDSRVGARVTSADGPRARSGRNGGAGTGVKAGSGSGVKSGGGSADGRSVGKAGTPSKRRTAKAGSPKNRASRDQIAAKES